MINYLKNTSKQIIIYGLGADGKKIVSQLLRENIHIEKIIDNNPALQGQKFQNIGIVSEAYLNEEKGIIAIVGCNNFKIIKERLYAKGVTEVYGRKDMFIIKRTTYPVLQFSETERPIVSIVVTAKDEWNYTYNCIESIYKRKTNVPFEVILGDNCSTDETRIADRIFKGIKVIHHKTNLYYLGNCNETIKYAKGKYIYLLGNDTLVQNDYYLENFLKVLLNKKAIAVSAKTILPCNDEIPIATAQKYNSEGKLFWVEDRTQEVDFLLVTNMMILKEAWEYVGGYSTEYLPAYYEDNDLCMKLKYQGYKLFYLAQSSEVIHFEGVTVSQEQNNSKKNYDLFLNKWGPFINVLKTKEFENEKGKRYGNGKK